MLDKIEIIKRLPGVTVNGEVYIREKDAIFLHSDEKKDTKWEDIRIQAAITAMQGMLANPTNIETSTDGAWKGKTKITKLAVIYADELIKELKKDD